MDISRPSGPQAHVVRVVQTLCDKGHHVRLVQLTDRGIRWTDNLEDWTSQEFPRRWRPFTRFIERPIRRLQSTAPFLPYLNYFDSLRFADLAKPILKDIDILYERYNFMSYGGVLLSRMLSVPLLLEINGHPFDEARSLGEKLSWQQRIVSIEITRRTLQQASVVLPSGYGWKRRFIQTDLLTHDRVNVIWPGIDYDRFDTDRNTDLTRTRWSLHSTRVIAFTGSFDPWQGLDTLIQAFARVCQHFSDAILVLAGDGLLYDDMVTLADNMGCNTQVRFLGRISQEEVADLLSITDIGVLCLKNRAEYVAMKLFDYMASGIATVVTAPAQCHDLIVNGKTGLVIEPGDVEALARVLAYLLQNEEMRQQLGNAAKTLVRERHTWTHRANEIEAVAANLIAER